MTVSTGITILIVGILMVVTSLILAFSVGDSPGTVEALEVVLILGLVLAAVGLVLELGARISK